MFRSTGGHWGKHLDHHDMYHHASIGCFAPCEQTTVLSWLQSVLMLWLGLGATLLGFEKDHVLAQQYLDLLPQTQLEMSRILVKNTWFWHHKHDLK